MPRRPWPGRGPLGAVLLVALAAVPEVRGDFMKNLQHLNPAAIVAPLANKNPAEIVQGIAGSVAKGQAAKTVLDAVKGIAAGNTSNVAHSLEPAQKHVSGALEAASNALQRGALAVGTASAGGVAGTLKDSQGRLSGATGVDVQGAAQALTHAQPADLAGAIRSATPQVAGALNRTSHQLAKTLEDHSAGLASSVNHEGEKVAHRIEGDVPAHGAMPTTDLAGAGATAAQELLRDTGLGAPLIGGVLLVLGAGVGYVGYHKFGRRSTRAPVLLSESEFTRCGGGSFGGGGAVRTEGSSEPFFTQF